MTTEHYLKVAKKCGASTLQEHWQLYPYRISFGHEEFDAYNARILAEKDAEIERLKSELKDEEEVYNCTNKALNHVTRELSAYTARICAEKDAEIERLNSALCGCEDTWRERLSIANAAIAIKDEALKDIATYPHKTDEVLRWANEAISTTPESIAAWEAEKLEPLRKRIVELEEQIKK